MPEFDYKRHLINSGMKIIGSGTLASAPAASASNKDLLYMSTDFGLCKSSGVFNNVGTDLINCGVLPYLAPIASSNGAITIEILYCTSSINVFAAPVSWADSESLINLAVKQRTTNKLWALTTGSVLVESSNVITSNTFNKVIVSRRQASTAITLNSVSTVVSASSTLSTVNRKFFIGGHPTNENIEGRVWRVRVYSGYTGDESLSALTMLDEWDFNKWDGSANGMSLNGYPFVVSDGTPFTAKGYSWIPMSLLQ